MAARGERRDAPSPPQSALPSLPARRPGHPCGNKRRYPPAARCTVQTSHVWSRGGLGAEALQAASVPRGAGGSGVHAYRTPSVANGKAYGCAPILEASWYLGTPRWCPPAQQAVALTLHCILLHVGANSEPTSTDCWTLTAPQAHGCSAVWPALQAEAARPDSWGLAWLACLAQAGPTRGCSGRADPRRPPPTRAAWGWQSIEHLPCRSVRLTPDLPSVRRLLNPPARPPASSARRRDGYGLRAVCRPPSRGWQPQRAAVRLARTHVTFPTKV